MSKAKLYKISSNETKKDDFLSIIVGIIVYALVLILASNLFEGFYVENFLYAVIAAIILSFLNATIKPLVVFLTIPLNIITFGIAYPIVNVIILELCDILMGDALNLGGFFEAFVIAIFISVMKIIFDSIITNHVGGK